MNIGVFDSGVGGKLIADKLKAQLSNHKIISISDDKYFPYGNKPLSFIYSRAQILTQKLVSQHCKLIIIACNTVSTHVINKLRHKFPNIIFVGIEPPIKPLSKLSQSKKVAIMATPATIKSKQYTKLIHKFAQNLKVYSIACHDLTTIIQKAIRLNKKPKAKILLTKLLDKPIKSGVDTVGLACTHYPYVLDQLQKLYPQVTFYDPSDAVVKQVKRLCDTKS